MPARSERLFLFPKKKDAPSQVIPFPVWWDRRVFFDKYRDRRLDTGNPFYVDYAFLLTMGEALTWNKACQENFTDHSRYPRRNLASEMQQFETALKNARWVVVESYEWESGLD